MNETFSNGTAVELFYEPGEKVVLSLVPLLTLLVGIFIYKRTNRPLQHSDSIEKRLHILYKLTAGIIWGQFFFHALPNATTYGEHGYRLRSLFFLLGYCVLLGYEELGRIVHPNPDYVAPPLAKQRDEFDRTVDRTTQQRFDYLDVDDARSEVAARHAWDTEDNKMNLRGRRVVSILFYMVMAFNCVLGGFLLIDTPPGTPHMLAIAMFGINKVLESIAVFTTLMHSEMYTESSHACGKRLFMAFLYGWSLLVACSTIPLIADLTPPKVTSYLESLGLGAFYGVFAGLLFWYAGHFQRMDLADPTKKQLVLSFLAFTVMALISWTTGYVI